MIEQALAFCEHVIAEHGARVERGFADAVPPVRGMHEQLIQVFVNLFTNACHAMPGGGTLSIRTTSRQLTASEVSHDAGARHADRFHLGETVVIAEVSDTGTGIADDKLSHIYDPFFTTKETGKGTGLGLTVTKKIIELHGGAIEVRNRNEGGACVTVMFKV